MEQKALTGYERKETGKGPNRRLRTEGKFPAIVYGVNEPVMVAIDSREFHTNFKTVSENTIIDLTIGKKKHQVLVKDFQQDILSGQIFHIDFMEIEKGKLIKTHVPVHLTGNSTGVREGGILEQKLDELAIECLPKDLPAEILVDISNLELGSSIHIKDFEAPKGIKILDDDARTIVVVTAPKAAAVATESEEADAEEAVATEGAE